MFTAFEKRMCVPSDGARVRMTTSRGASRSTRESHFLHRWHVNLFFVSHFALFSAVTNDTKSFETKHEMRVLSPFLEYMTGVNHVSHFVPSNRPLRPK